MLPQTVTGEIDKGKDKLADEVLLQTVKINKN